MLRLRCWESKTPIVKRRTENESRPRAISAALQMLPSGVLFGHVFCVHETPLGFGGVCGTCLFLNDVHDRWPEDAVELLEGPQDASDETAALSPEQA